MWLWWGRCAVSLVRGVAALAIRPRTGPQVVMSLFAFSRHGFCNHYYFVFGAMLCALVTYSAQCGTDTPEHAVAIAGQ